MNSQQIEAMINELKVDSLGRIRNKSKVIDKIHAAHLKKVDNMLMDIRILVARMSDKYDAKTVKKLADEFIYKIQIS